MSVRGGMGCPFVITVCSMTMRRVWIQHNEKVTQSCCTLYSDVLAWLGLEATGFGLALGGFGFWDPQAKP